MKSTFWIAAILFTIVCGDTRYTNALIDTQSPYLRQHAHNPVNWHAWNDESFAKAKKEDKLIFLSIGYSTCHWCHVMEKESFEDEAIATLLNKDYISIKVDKEEMPHIDAHYQKIHSFLKEGRNGWPLSVIMTSGKEILFIATYIPPKDDYGIEGMHTILPKYAKLYHENKTRLTKLITANQTLIAKGETIPYDLSDTNLTKRFVVTMGKRYDRVYKGFDKRPRFPLASHLRYLLEIYRLENNEKAYKMVSEAMKAMANGGIYDQVEGAFFRYSVDQDWIIPHFEKMLYTTAELAPLYTKLYMMTDNPRYKAIVIESIDEITQRFGANGLFYAASDADSDGEEGRYFVYDYENVKNALQKADYNETQIDENMEYYDIFESGNFEHGLSQPHTNTGFDTPPKRFEETKEILKKLRASRHYPFIDQKIITAWNAMMITALFDASTIEPRYADQALSSLETLLKKHYVKGTLYHQSLGNHPPVQKALLEDYAFLAEALVCAYEKAYEKRYLNLAREIIESAKAKFYNEGTWYLDDTAFRAKTTYEDRYYTAPLPKLLQAMLSVAYLQYDLKLMQETKGYIEKEKPRILAAFDASPEALRLLTRLEYGDIVLKSTKTNLIQNADTIANIHYPYLLHTTEDTKIYLLCDEKTCFFYDKNLTKVIEQIK